MEAQIFVPDSSRFILHESTTAHGSDKSDPNNHRYLLCDLDDNCSLHPITDEVGTTAPSISPDGRYLYYFVDETEPGGGRLTLKRVVLDGSDRRTLLILDAPLPQTTYHPSRIYPLSTIRADGKTNILSCFLGDGQSTQAPWGLMVFDLDRMSVELILAGESWCNIHSQYSRSTNPELIQDILIQENHGNISSATGEIQQLMGDAGVDVHVIKDNGTDFRNMPWGRDSNEFCQGHQCWRGTTSWAITSTRTKKPAEQQLIESQAVAHMDHVGRASPEARRKHLSRSYPRPCFYHFATDRAGNRLVTDTSLADQGGRIFTATLNSHGQDALSNCICLANPRSS